MTMTDRTKSNAINWLLVAWATAQVILGGLYMADGWGIVALVGGMLLLPVAVFGLARGRWVEPIITAQLLLAGSLIAASIVTGNLPAGLTGIVLLVLIGSTMIVSAQIVQSGKADETHAERRATPMPAGNAQMEHLLRELHDATMLSDAAKRVLFRQRDITAVRQAVQEEIARGAYEVAAQLCDDLELILDQGPMAQQLRATIEAAQRQTHDDRFQSDLASFEQLLAGSNWAAAQLQADALHERYGEMIIDANLHDRIQVARQERKAELQSQFLHAASLDDLDRAMELLRLLDQYLTREEADQLGEAAQNVVVKHRDRLGVEFRQAVNDHAWHDAARIGQIIIAEFPNTKMADEVGSMIDLIRTRATEAAIVAQSDP